MLVLARKPSQRIRISDDIIITIVDVVGEKVRVGIDAPKHIPVHREEVYEVIQEENARLRRLKEVAGQDTEGPPR